MMERAMRRDLPSGTVTFLFTDVEGSTKLLGEIGDEAYDDALAEHRRIVRGACVAQSGVEVDTQGDAFFFAFPSAPEAVMAAETMTDDLASGPIKVRIGLHTGEPRLSAEGYVGKEVHFAARVAATGHGGQIVLSRATADLLDGSSLTELGEHRLKDIAEPVAIYQLGSERFPPLKTISNTNLPRPASSFVGREAEVAEIIGKLERGARLLTLTGPGGSGKTRLALEAATTLVPEYKAGVFWVGLAALRDPALVPETIAQTLGSKTGLAEHIGGREMLLLLDNLEQVVESAPELSALLESCPNLTFLCTSRELLRVQGEVEYPVPPLASSEAVTLFCARSRLDPSEEVTELCARLDNLPLAVELAAARTKALAPAQILARLSHRLDLLKGGRDADPRQRTLRATIAWSYELLTDEEQRVFQALSVFAGGCTLEAAEEVVDADLDTLQSLVEKSLLRFSNSRYWMLETIREYCDETLASSNDSDETRRAHAEWCSAFVRSNEARTEESFDRLEEELANVRAALEWLRQSNPPRFAELAELLWPVWLERGYGVEAQRALGEALDLSPDPSSQREQLLAGASWAALYGGDRASGRLYGEERLAVARHVGEYARIANATGFLGSLALEEERFDEAVELLTEAVAIHREHGSETLGVAVYNLGFAWDAVRDAARATAAFSEARDLFRAAGDSANVARSTLSLGGAALLDGRPEEARALVVEGLRSLASPHASVIPSALVMLSAAEASRGELERAARLLAAVEATNEARGSVLEAQHQRRFDEVKSIVVEELGHDVLHRAWNEGRAMTIDAAVEYAIVT